MKVCQVKKLNAEWFKVCVRVQLFIDFFILKRKKPERKLLLFFKAEVT